jgi:hypothetical protein
MYVRYPLSLRNVEDLLAERGIDISFASLKAHSMRPPAKLAHLFIRCLGKDGFRCKRRVFK